MQACAANQLDSGFISLPSPCRTEREAFNVDNQHRFEDALAAVTPRRTAALERMHLQKFQDERIRQDEVVAQVSDSCHRV